MTEVVATTPGESLILGKFKSVDDLASAYKSLETKLGQRAAPAIGEPAPAHGDPATPSVNQSTIRAQVMSEVHSAFSHLRAGDPAAEAKLTALGLDPTLARYSVDLAVNGQQLYRNSIYKEAGGKEAYEGINTWVQENTDISPFERASYFAAIDSGDPARVIPNVRLMRDRHRQETGYEPAQLTVAIPGGAPARVSPFANTEEVGRAFSDPKYGTDAAYTAQVQARAQISECLNPGGTAGQ